MESFKAFRDKLDQEHKWPDAYVFKFIVPQNSVIEFKEEFTNEVFDEKLSKAGNYTSFTLKKILNSSDEVVTMYLKARKVEGVISL
jgi:putative lipoic acid-binding regulatory protein